MPLSDAELALLISARNEASAKLKEVNKDAGGLGKTLGDVGKIAAGFLAANVIGAGVQKLTGFIGDSVAATKESIAVDAQLAAVLKSTAGVAGVTADEIKNMGSQMEKLSLFEDEAIVSSSSLLLTFTKVGKDVFPKAQQAILDLSQAMGTDLQASTVMIGKALNDPIRGITAMTRAGIQFTEEQKEMIKGMVEAGNVAGAQAVILKELETQFGGSAKAASDAAGQSEKMKDRMNDLSEEIGAKLLPIQEKLTEAKLMLVNVIATKVIPMLTQLSLTIQTEVVPVVEQIIAVFRDHLVPAFITGSDTILSAIKPVFDFIIGNHITLSLAIAAIGTAIVIALGPVSLAVIALLGLIEVVGLVQNNWEELKKAADRIWGEIKGTIKREINQVIEDLNRLIGIYNSTLGRITGRVGELEQLDTYADRLQALGQAEMPDRPAVTPETHPLIPFPPDYYQHGTNFVRRTGLAMLHRGEAVISESANSWRGGSGISVTINGNVINSGSGFGDPGDIAYSIVDGLKRRGAMI